MEKEKEDAEEIRKEQGKNNIRTDLSAFEGAVDEIEEIESAFRDEIEYEEISEVESSPMNEAVKQGEVSEGTRAIHTIDTEEKPAVEMSESPDIPPELLQQFEEDNQPAYDAPEQEIDAAEEELNGMDDEPLFEKSEALASQEGLSEADHHAGIAADSLIGVTDNLLETGGGFFVRIEKSKAYHDFDRKVFKGKADPNRLIAKIDVFNDKNIKRIKLDEEDKRQLRPVLKEVLKRQTKAMTPEQQLMALGISILIKKGKAVIEMRNESKALKNHFDEVVKEYFQRMETININLKEQEVQRNAEESTLEEKEVVAIKGEENGEEGENNQTKQAA